MPVDSWFRTMRSIPMFLPLRDCAACGGEYRTDHPFMCPECVADDQEPGWQF